MKKLIQKHPVTAYFIITFGWTWLIVLGMILSGQIKDVSTPTPVFIIGGFICSISPSIAAILVTRITHGKAGVRSLLGKFNIKSAPKWTIMALCTVPIITALTTLLSNQFLRSYTLNLVIPTLIMGLVWPMVAGFGEEFGWRGFILPKMLKNSSVLKSGILLGIIWEVWHIPMHWIGFKDFGVYMIPAMLVIGFINMTLQSVVMAYLFSKSNGNVRLMVIYHFTITSSSILLGGLFKTESLPQFTVYEGLISCSLFLFLALVLYAKEQFVPKTVKEENPC